MKSKVNLVVCALASIIGLGLVYLVVAFVEMSFSPANWLGVSRLVYSVVGCWWIYIVATVVYEKEGS